MKCSLGILVALLAVCSAQVPNFGWCPDYVPMSDFDMERFMGRWYESERYFQVSELGTRCVVSDYAKSDNGKIFVSNEVTSRITGVKRILSGDLELVGRAGEGKIKVRYQTSPISSTTTLSVLDTDYDSYSVLWSCSNYGPIYTQNAWVMTRERLPPGTIMQKAYNVLDRYKISRTFFQRTEQEGCSLAASEINAAQGWNNEGSQSVETDSGGKSAGLILEDRVDAEKQPETEEEEKVEQENVGKEQAASVEKLEEVDKIPEEPIKKLEEPSKKLEEQIKKLEEPIKKLEEPIKKLEEPIKKLEEPIKKLEEPIKKLEEPIKKLEEPIKKQEEPVKKPLEVAQHILKKSESETKGKKKLTKDQSKSDAKQIH